MRKTKRESESTGKPLEGLEVEESAMATEEEGGGEAGGEEGFAKEEEKWRRRRRKRRERWRRGRWRNPLSALRDQSVSQPLQSEFEINSNSGHPFLVLHSIGLALIDAHALRHNMRAVPPSLSNQVLHIAYVTPYTYLPVYALKSQTRCKRCP